MRTLFFVLALVGCGGGAANVSRDQLYADFRTATDRPLASPAESAENSRVVQRLIEADALSGMTRAEVQQVIGQGDPCSRHPRCQENDFDGDDWFYSVGQVGSGYSGTLPQLIVGFDSSGHVLRVWNLSTHED